MMEEERALEDAISEIVRERFSGVGINSIEVRPDVDSDGDKIYRILIFVDQNVETLDSRKMAGLVRHLRPRLEKIRADGFPLVSFISRNDAMKLKREPA